MLSPILNPKGSDNLSIQEYILLNLTRKIFKFHQANFRSCQFMYFLDYYSLDLFYLFQFD